MAEITLASLLPYIFTVAGIILAWVLGRRKDSADISQKLGEASDKLSELYETRIKLLEQELLPLRPLPEHVARLERIIIAYQEGVKKLLNQFKQHHIEPEWEPSPSCSTK